LGEPGIVFYDGTCGFCDWSVQWLLHHDPAGQFVFAPLQGETARRHGLQDLTHDPASVVLVRPDAPEGRQRLDRSDAVLAILAKLGQPWRALSWLKILPRVLRNPFYELFARYRYKVAGKIDACRIPAEHERARFLP
jgi:predicted DCC family thiol-disulfide oxidoreductase YuxK